MEGNSEPVVEPGSSVRLRAVATRDDVSDVTKDSNHTTKDNASVTSSDVTSAKADLQIDTTIPRTIGLVGGISFIIGTIIGSGIFISPKGVAEGSGSVGMTLVSWALCGIISMLGAFCYAELGTIIKLSGADYVYLHEAYGPLASYIFSWINNVLVKPGSMATIMLTCSQYIMTPFFDDGCGEAPAHIKKLAAIFFLMLLTAINMYSVRLASNIQIIFTVAKLFAISIIIIGGIVKLCQGYTENLATGFQGTETSVGLIVTGLYSGMWAYDGWNTANFMTEELINPQRNLPIAILVGVPIVIIVYLLTNVSYFTVMSVDQLIASPAVALTWANEVIPNFAWVIPIFVALTTFGTGNGSLFTSGRLVYAAARNDHLPEFLAMVHVTKFTPIPALIITFILSVLFILPGNIAALIDFLSFTIWIFYGMNMAGVIIFRFSKKYKDMQRPVKTPLIIPIITLVCSVILVFVPLITAPQIGYLFAIGFIILGYILYIPFVHFKVRFQFMKKLTMYTQLYLQVFIPTQMAD